MSTEPRNNTSVIWLTLALTFFNFTGNNSMRVLMTLYALHLGASATTAGVIGGLLFLFPVLLSWVVGGLADRKAARKLLLFAASCAALAVHPRHWAQGPQHPPGPLRSGAIRTRPAPRPRRAPGARGGAAAQPGPWPAGSAKRRSARWGACCVARGSGGLGADEEKKGPPPGCGGGFVKSDYP